MGFRNWEQGLNALQILNRPTRAVNRKEPDLQQGVGDLINMRLKKQVFEIESYLTKMNHSSIGSRFEVSRQDCLHFF